MGCGIACFGRRGPNNHLKLKILVSKFFPMDLEGQRTDLEGQCSGASRGGAHGTSRGGAGVLRGSTFSYST